MRTNRSKQSLLSAVLYTCLRICICFSSKKVLHFNRLKRSRGKFRFDVPTESNAESELSNLKLENNLINEGGVTFVKRGTV